jgi:hypothetical protein
VSGRNYLTGEIWAFPVEILGEPDILINAASGPGIVKTVRRLIKAGTGSSLQYN